MSKKDSYIKQILTNKNMFDGGCFNWDLDHSRLTTQMAYVFLVIMNGEYTTVEKIQSEISAKFGCRGAQTSISALLRDFRKKKWGEHTVNTRRVGNSGLYEYQFVFNPDAVVMEEEIQLKLDLK